MSWNYYLNGLVREFVDNNTETRLAEHIELENTRPIIGSCQTKTCDYKITGRHHNVIFCPKCHNALVWKKGPRPNVRKIS